MVCFPCYETVACSDPSQFWTKNAYAPSSRTAKRCVHFATTTTQVVEEVGTFLWPISRHSTFFIEDHVFASY